MGRISLSSRWTRHLVGGLLLVVGHLSVLNLVEGHLGLWLALDLFAEALLEGPLLVLEVGHRLVDALVRKHGRVAVLRRQVLPLGVLQPQALDDLVADVVVVAFLPLLVIEA